MTFPHMFVTHAHFAAFLISINVAGFISMLQSVHSVLSWHQFTLSVTYHSLRLIHVPVFLPICASLVTHNIKLAMTVIGSHVFQENQSMPA
jgi:hypothetical protein